MGPEEIRMLAHELASPSNQLLNWLVIAAICIVSGLIQFWVGWIKKSAEIKAVTERLGEIVKQTEAIATAQETIKQQMAHAIWRDRRKWNLEYKLHLELLLNFNRYRSIYIQLERRQNNLDTDKQTELVAKLMDLENDHRDLMVRAGMLMPAEVYNKFYEAVDFRPIARSANIDSTEGSCEFFKRCNAATAQAEIFVRRHARERLGIA